VGLEEVLVGETRSGLHNRPILALSVVVLVYVGTEVLSEIVAQFAGVTGPGWKHAAIKLTCFVGSTFLFVPFVLALPDGERSLRRFVHSVGLARFTPVVSLTALTAACYLVFVISQLAGSMLYHMQLNESFVLDFSRHTLLDARSITSGFFEEVMLRGVLLSILVRRYSDRRSIIAAAAVFGGLHLLNALNPTMDSAWVLAQATWAFFLGALYGLLFIRTGSIYPSVVLHYLGNGMVGVWFRGLDSQGIVAALYGLPFYGVLPALVNIYLVAHLCRRGDLGHQERPT
jgi:membrane protease YdiL (CAAX protease family)